jgi:hypothetical protein
MLLKVYDKIRNLKMPEHWKEEGTEPPNKIAMQKAYQCCCYLYSNYKLKPSFIACTIISGIFIKYKGTNLCLVIEIDNEGFMGFLVNNNLKKEIVHNEEIKDVENLNISKCISIFTRSEKNKRTIRT